MSLLSFIRPRKQPLLGIDISSTSVKLIELSQQGNTYRVESYAVEPLPPNAVIEKNIADIDGVAATLKQALRKSGTRLRTCALAIPSSVVISKQITIPANITEQALEGQIQIEAEQYIPYALEEVNLDFEVTGPSPNNPDMIDVLLVASRSENVEVRVGVADLAGLTPKVVDVESYASEQAVMPCFDRLPNRGGNKVVAVVDIGHTMASISVFENLNLAYTREQPFGGKLLTEDIMRRYGLSYNAAGLTKKSGEGPENYLAEVLEPFKEIMAQQVHRFLQFYFAASEHQSVDYILLAGGCASIPEINEALETHLHTPTGIANPFARMSTSPHVNAERLGNDAPALLIACGLAMRSFD